MRVVVVTIIPKESTNLFIRLAMRSLQTRIHSFPKIEWTLITVAGDA